MAQGFKNFIVKFRSQKQMLKISQIIGGIIFGLVGLFSTVSAQTEKIEFFDYKLPETQIEDIRINGK